MEKLKSYSLYPKNSFRIQVAAFLLVAIIFAGTFLIDSGEPEWQKEVLADDVSERFVALNAEDSLDVFYLESRDGVVKSKSISLTGLSSIFSWGWKETTVDEGEGTGSFLSATNLNGETAIAYQDGNVGEASVHYAERVEGDWVVDTIDGIGINGPNVGLYTSVTSINENPLVFYHAPRGERFMAAEKVSGEWQRQELEVGTGWFTDSATCGEEAYAAFRDRGEESISIGTYDGGWSVEDTGVGTNTDVAIATDGCEPFIAYLDSETGKIAVEGVGELEEFSSSGFSRISLEIEDDYHLLYNVRQEGMFYVESDDGESWEKEQLSNSTEADSYSDLAIDSEGDVHIAYLDGSDLVYLQESKDNNLILYRVLLFILALVMAFLIISNRTESGARIPDFIKKFTE